MTIFPTLQNLYGNNIASFPSNEPKDAQLLSMSKQIKVTCIQWEDNRYHVDKNEEKQTSPS